MCTGVFTTLADNGSYNIKSILSLWGFALGHLDNSGMFFRAWLSLWGKNVSTARDRWENRDYKDQQIRH